MSSAIPKDDILPGGILPSAILNETIARVTDILGDELDAFLDLHAEAHFLSALAEKIVLARKAAAAATKVA